MEKIKINKYKVLLDGKFHFVDASSTDIDMNQALKFFNSDGRMIALFTRFDAYFNLSAESVDKQVNCKKLPKAIDALLMQARAADEILTSTDKALREINEEN